MIDMGGLFFVIGFFIGLIAGVVTDSLCKAATDDGDYYDHLRNYYEKGYEDGLRSANAGKEEGAE